VRADDPAAPPPRLAGASRVVLVLGAAALGLFLWRASPRDVLLLYDVAGVPGATAIEVEIRRGEALSRRAVLRIPAGEARAGHPVRLTAGAYSMRIRVESPDGPAHFERPLEVTEDGAVVVPLSR
jgi:hypothetical protein